MEPSEIIDAARSIVENETDPESAVLAVMKLLKQSRADLHWVGVYVLVNDELRVGPYVGPHTDHIRIPIGRGVCGTAVATGKSQIVDDVRALDNYLACNTETRSEIVVLIRDETGAVIGQIDIDSTTPAGFDNKDEDLLEEIGTIIARRVSAIKFEMTRT